MNATTEREESLLTRTPTACVTSADPPHANEATIAAAEEPSAATPELEDGSSALEVIEKWTSSLVPYAGGEEDATGIHSRYLARTYRIPQETALLISCGALSAAAGPLRSLQGPGSITTPPAFNFMLVSNSPMGVQLAASDAFTTLSLLARRNIWNQAYMTERMAVAEEAEIAAKIKEAAKIQEQSDEARVWWVTNHGADFEQTWGGYLAKNPQDYQKLAQQAQNLREEAAADFARLQMERLPGFLVEGVCPEDLMEVHELSGDGSVFNLDLQGNTWSALMTERPANARMIAQRIKAGWQGVPFMRSGKLVPASTLSSLSVHDMQEFGRLWRSRVMRDGNLRHTLLVADADARTTMEDDGQPLPADALSRFNDLLTSLLYSRDWSKDETVKLGNEACEVFFDFVEDVKEVEMLRHLFDPDIARSAASHALRLALMLHLGAGFTEKQEVSETTMRRACHLVSWSAAGAMDALQRMAPAGFTAVDCGEDEVFAMVARVRRKGPLPIRELFRSYNDQSYSRLMPILEQAFNAGILMKAEDGTVTAPEGQV